MEFCCEYMGGEKGLTEIGNALGKVSVAALSYNSRRLIEKMRENEELRKQYEEIREKLEDSQSIVND